VLSDSPNVIEHGTTKTGRWLRPRRMRLALWIAVAEGILVALFHDVTRTTVVLLAVICILLYVLWGRSAKSDTARQVTWIAGASQALAVLFVLLAVFAKPLVYALIVIVALIAIAFFFVDRR
jgi:hypothetical protein